MLWFNRVKSLSKSGNPRKDQSNSLPSSAKEPSSATTSSAAAAAEADDLFEQYQESKAVDTSRKVSEKETSSFNFSEEEKQPSSFSTNYNFSGRDESSLAAAGMEKEQVDVKKSSRGSTSQKTSSANYSQSSTDVEEKVQKVSPPRQKAIREDRLRRDFDNLDIMSPSSHKQQNMNNSNANTSFAKQSEPEQPPDGSINEILEVCFKPSSQKLFIRTYTIYCLCVYQTSQNMAMVKRNHFGNRCIDAVTKMS